MLNIQKIEKNKDLIRVGALVAALFFLIVFSSFSSSINRNIESIFYAIEGSSQPDTNIVLIRITERDIENLGGWPLKRSYYALLLSKLKHLKVRKIGLEIFLSGKNDVQNINDNQFLNELEEDKIVLSCYVNSITSYDDVFYTDSIIYPLTNLSSGNKKVGHTNYFEFDNIYVPQRIINNSDTLYSFASSLVERDQLNNKWSNLLKLNFTFSFNSFKSLTITEFFNLFESDKPRLDKLKDKIVLIGVVDPTIGKTVNTNFDENLPGIGLHATATDNLLNDRFLNENFIAPSTILLIVLILLCIFIVKKNHVYFFPILLILLLCISFIIFSLSYIELNYTAFLLPIFLMMLLEFTFNFFKKVSKSS